MLLIRQSFERLVALSMGTDRQLRSHYMRVLGCATLKDLE